MRNMQAPWAMPLPRHRAPGSVLARLLRWARTVRRRRPADRRPLDQRVRDSGEW